jgi:hypothetical protein
MARGVNFIIPVGIEKMIPYSITEAAKRVGKERFYKSVGMPVGLIPVYGTVITEIEALILLGAEDAFTIGAGGVAGGEGSVVIMQDTGCKNVLNKAWEGTVEFFSEIAISLNFTAEHTELEV